MFSFLDGYKTYIVGGIGLLVAVAELLGFDVVPGVDKSNAIDAIWASLGLLGLRHALPAKA